MLPFLLFTVNEPGLYTLILGSRKPIAKRFKRWVVHEVLPSIRKTGNYSLEQEKSKSEKQFRPEITAKDRMDALKILKMGTNSRTQHDQLKWSADIVSVLQEHVPRI